MAGNTVINEWPIPELEDIRNIETATRNFANGIDARANPIFASTSARDAAINFPAEGVEAFVTGTAGKFIYDRTTATSIGWKVMAPFRRYSQLSGTAASVTFSSIPSTLKAVRITWRARTNGGGAIHSDPISMRINNSSSNVYYWNNLYSAPPNVVCTTISPWTYCEVGHMIAAGGTANQFSGGLIEIYGWNAPTSHLGWTCHSSTEDETGIAMQSMYSGRYNAAGPYTSIVLFPSTGSFIAGSLFGIEGWD